MKTTTILFINLLITFTVFAQGSFEGKIVLRAENTASNEVSDITWYMKNGQHMLSYVNTGKVNSTYSLLSKGGKLEMINERGRVNIPGNSMKQPNFDFSTYKLLNKEGSKLINDFNCIKYTIESAENIAECWFADDADVRISDFPEFMISGLITVCEKLHQGGIPIQIIVRDKSNKMLYQQTISYIMPCKVDDVKFK